MLLQLRARPHRRERDERDDQDDRRRPAEQPDGDRQVGLADDPVRLRRSPGGQRAPPARARRAAAAACDGAGLSCRAAVYARRCALAGPPRSPPRSRTLLGSCSSTPLAVSTGASAVLQLGPLAIARRCSTRAACARSRRTTHPVPGWRQACFYGGFVVIAVGAHLARRRQPGPAVRAHDRAPAARRHRRAVDRARPDRAAARAGPSQFASSTACARSRIRRSPSRCG